MNKPTEKNAAAVALGRLGGKARSQNSTQAERTALAKLAAAARWRTKPKGRQPKK